MRNIPIFLLFALVAFGGANANAQRNRNAIPFARYSFGPNIPLLSGTDRDGMLSGQFRIGECTFDLPSCGSLQDLNTMFEYKYHRIDKQDATTLNNIGFGDVMFNKKDELILMEFSQRRVYHCLNQERGQLQFGAAVFVLLRVNKKSIKKGFSLTDLAYRGHKKRGAVTFNIRTVGVTGRHVTSLLPDRYDLDIDTYKDLMNMKAFIERLYQTNEANEVVICPQLLPFVERTATRVATGGGATAGPNR